MLSKRERLIALAALVIVALLPADRFVLTPVVNKLSSARDTRQGMLDQLQEAETLFERRRVTEKTWRQFGSGGIETESQAESRVLHAVGQWAQDSRLTLTAVRPQRLSSENSDLQEMTVSVTGTGGLQAATRFLWNVEQAGLPVKIKDIQLGSANDTGNEMSLQVRLSTLYVGAAQEQAGNENEQGH